MEITSTIATSLTTNKNEKDTQETNEVSHSFSDSLKESKEKSDNSLNKETTESLLADIFSMIKTGLTVSELERLQELLAEINDLRTGDENSENNQKIKAMLSALEDEVAKLQERFAATNILEKDENAKIDDKEETTGDSSIDSRIENVTTMINNMTSAKLSGNKMLDELLGSNESVINKTEYMTDEELKLREKLNK